MISLFDKDVVMAFAPVNDISLYYEEHGEGYPLVLISGFSADHLVWEPILENLSQHFRVITLDNRGAGQTSIPDTEYTIDQLAADVIALCDYLKVTEAFFMGNSMGGCIIQTLAHQYPQYVKKAVISNSTMVTHSTFRFFLEAQYELMCAAAPQHAIIKASRSWVYSYPYLSQPGIIDQVIETALNNPFPFTQTGFRGQRAALFNFDSRQWAKDIAVPTLIITSSEDIILPPHLSQSMADTIPLAQYHCFDSVGHLPFVEKPQDVMHHLTPFFSNIG